MYFKIILSVKYIIFRDGLPYKSTNVRYMSSYNACSQYVTDKDNLIHSIINYYHELRDSLHLI